MYAMYLKILSLNPDILFHLFVFRCRVGGRRITVAHFHHLQRDLARLPQFVVHQMAERFSHSRHLEPHLCIVKHLPLLPLAVCLLVL